MWEAGDFIKDREQHLGKAMSGRKLCELLLGDEIEPFARPEDGWDLRRWERQLLCGSKSSQGNESSYSRA